MFGKPTNRALARKSGQSNLFEKQVAREKPGNDEQHQRRHNLRDHQRVAKPLPSRY
jgi:hypothetical protein